MRLSLILMLLYLVCVQCMTEELLYIKASCNKTFRIKDKLTVTVHDVGQVCPERSIAPPHYQFRHRFIFYNLDIKQTSTGREIELDWEHSNCYQDYYILFEVSFYPEYVLHNGQRRCVHVVVTHLSNEWPGDSRIYYNCLGIRTRNTGTLSISTDGENICRRKRTSENITFDLGCSLNQTSVTVDRCLNLEFWEFSSRHLDSKRSSITLYGEDYCVLETFDASYIIGYSDPMKMILPVYRNGTYHIEVELECNANGEIERKRFPLQTITVTNANSCWNYNSTLPSNCFKNNQPEDVVTTRPDKKPQTQIYTAITVVSVIGTVMIIVTVIFIHRQRKSFKQRQPERPVSSSVEAVEMNLLNT